MAVRKMLQAHGGELGDATQKCRLDASECFYGFRIEETMRPAAENASSDSGAGPQGAAVALGAA